MSSPEILSNGHPDKSGFELTPGIDKDGSSDKKRCKQFLQRDLDQLTTALPGGSEIACLPKLIRLLHHSGSKMIVMR